MSTRDLDHVVEANPERAVTFEISETTSLKAIGAWLDDHGLSLRVNKERSSWLADVVGPRGSLKARGWGASLFEAVRRAVVNYERGIAP